MEDREIRSQAQSRGWWYAASRTDGPAHIIDNDRHSLCGYDYDTKAQVRATNLCQKCRNKAIKIFAGAA